MCGIVGIRSYKETDTKTLAYYSMLALQHRGQQSAGIAWHYGESLAAYSKVTKGSVNRLFAGLNLDSKGITNLVGHTRYSTTGGDLVENIQPFIFTSSLGQFSLVHNGNLVNTKEITSKLILSGVQPKGTTDSELIGLLIARYLSAYEKASMPDAISFAVRMCKGAISLVIGCHDKLYGYRDPYGIRPLIIGEYDTKAYVLASETCALDVIGATYLNSVRPGTIVEIGDYVTNHIVNISMPPRRCIFEDIYFSRPDSINDANYSSNKNPFEPVNSIYEYRLELGRLLSKEHPVEVDLIIGTPDSGIPGAIGYAEASRIPYGEGLIKNKYVGRTFIQPTQTMRQQGVRLKLNAIPNVLENKRIVLVDDSIVRGNTCKRTIESLRLAGAKEVHMRITSPPVKHPCYFGLDFPNTDELAACNMSQEELREFIGADSLGYLSIDACLTATNYIDNHYYGGHGPDKGYCTACFTGEYPI